MDSPIFGGKRIVGNLHKFVAAPFYTAFNGVAVRSNDIEIAVADESADLYLEEGLGGR